MIWLRTFINRYRMRIARLGGLAIAGAVYTGLSRQGPQTLGAWAEVAGWTVLAYVIGRRLLTLAFDTTLGTLRRAGRHAVARLRGEKGEG